MRPALLPAFTMGFPPAMTAQRDKKRRPVFLQGAVSRMLRQPWRIRPRTAAAISKFLLREIVWWLTDGLYHVPRTLRLSSRRKVLNVYPSKSFPSLHVYSNSHLEQYVHTHISPSDTQKVSDSESHPPIVLYIHGGAWGSGNATHYSQLASSIADSSRAIVLVLSYRLYPVATIAQQVDDVTAALQHIRSLFKHNTLTILAHSSGANITALSLLRNAASADPMSLADAAILTAGPYDLMHHYLFEARRGVADISPMLPASNAENDHRQFDQCSPSVIAEQLSFSLTEPCKPQTHPALEGDLPASNIPLPLTAGTGDGKLFPRTYIMTSSCDTVVPMYSSIRFVAALRQLSLNARLLVYDGAQHLDFVTDFFAAARAGDLSDLLDIEEADGNRRKACVEHLTGPAQSKLVERPQLQEGPSPYIRDVLRIIAETSAPCIANDP